MGDPPAFGAAALRHSARGRQMSRQFCPAVFWTFRPCSPSPVHVYWRREGANSPDHQPVAAVWQASITTAAPPFLIGCALQEVTSFLRRFPIPVPHRKPFRQHFTRVTASVARSIFIAGAKLKLNGGMSGIGPTAGHPRRQSGGSRTGSSVLG
jgi:hypothetical protein